MKGLRKFFQGSLFLLLLAVSQAQAVEEPRGFRGILWNQSYKKYKSILRHYYRYPYRPRERIRRWGYTSFIRTDEKKPQYAGVTLDRILYDFDRQGLFNVTLEKRYGRGRRYQAPFGSLEPEMLKILRYCQDQWGGAQKSVIYDAAPGIRKSVRYDWDFSTSLATLYKDEFADGTGALALTISDREGLYRFWDGSRF